MCAPRGANTIFQVYRITAENINLSMEVHP